MRTTTNSSTTHAEFIRGSFFVAYSIASYLVGLAGLMLLILVTTGFMPPGMFHLTDSQALSIMINVGLLLLFGMQHSVMARVSFKKHLHRVLPEPLERSTFVWASGAALGATVLFWQPVSDSVIWQSSGMLSWILLGSCIFGWAYLLAATFAINHWDLFGLRQSWLAARDQDYVEVPFTENWMYRYSRHPIQLGVLIGIWSINKMTITQLFLSVGLTAYIVIGVYFEERDLIRQWGQSYQNYKQRVGALLSLPRR